NRAHRSSVGTPHAGREPAQPAIQIQRKLILNCLNSGASYLASETRPLFSNSRAGFIACNPPALRRSFSVIGISLTGQKRRAFCAFAKICARPEHELRSVLPSGLLAKMPAPKAKKPKSKRPWKKWMLVLLAAFLVIPAMQVAMVRFINPPWTLPMLIEQGGTMFSSGPKHPLLYRWIDLPQIPEMFLEHLWISEDQRFFQHSGFDWKEMDIAVKKAKRKGKPVRGASTITNQCARSIFLWQGRSWIRKGLESYYTIWMEALLPKRRILELYANVIEMGRGIYGIEAA